MLETLRVSVYEKLMDDIKESWQVSEAAVQRFQEALPNIIALVNEKFRLEAPYTENQVILQNLDFVLDAHRYFGAMLLAVYQFQLWDNLIDEAMWYGQSVRSRGLDERYVSQMLKTWIISLHSYIKPPEVNELTRPLQWLSSQAPDLFQWEEQENVLTDKAAELLSLLLRNEKEKSEELLQSFFTEHNSTEAVMNQLFLPVLSKIGRLWCANQVSVADEHLTVANLRRLYQVFFKAHFGNQKRDGKIAICCVPGEEHEMGAELLSRYLENQGWDVVFIGHSAPEDEILRTLNQDTPFAVILSITLISHLPALKSLVQNLRTHFPALKILAGGDALQGQAKKVIQGIVDVVLSSFEECHQILHQMVKADA